MKHFEFLSKQSKVPMFGDLYNSGKNLCVDPGNSKVNAKQKIDLKNQAKIRRIEALKSYKKSRSYVSTIW